MPCTPKGAEPTLGKVSELVFVSAGLALDGGGRALAGRLLAGACERFARERELGLSMLVLSGPLGKARLALRVARQQLSGRRAVVFDLLGLARTAAYLPRALRAPYLVPMYGIDVWQPLSWDRQRALRDATVRFAISRHTLERALPFCGDLAGTEVVPLALEERAAEGAADEELLLRLGEGFLLLVARLAASERYKGVDELLAALAELPHARLVVAGEGDDRKRLEEKARGLGGRVAFTGFVSEATLAALYDRCAGFVMPSTGEGFGLVYLEAMRAGKPVIAVRGGAAEEIVLDDVTGRLVDSHNRAELAGAIARLLAEPERAREMGEAGRERYRAEFGYERFYRRMEHLLERLTAPERRSRCATRPTLTPGPSPWQGEGNTDVRQRSPSSPSLGQESRGGEG